MTSCDSCQKYPLELREINDVRDAKGRDVALCDKCYITAFKEWYPQAVVPKEVRA